MSIFDNYPPSATITAKEDSRVLVIPAATTMSMLSASHELCLNFLQIMSQRLRQDNKIVCEEQYHIRCIEENAKIDPMTGLHNRRWLEEMYTREMNRSNMGNFKLTAFMIDIDHFKQVNDTYGHLAGDKVLISVAQALIRSLRPSDMPVRYGGEEFSVFLPGTTEENAKIIAERIRRNVENMTITLHDNNLLQVTVSIGFAERIENDTVASLIDRADKALYHAKQNGRNRVCQNKDGINFLIS
jgi:diguanylate cyclase (GGDEF)-like protein